MTETEDDCRYIGDLCALVMSADNVADEHRRIDNLVAYLTQKVKDDEHVKLAAISTASFGYWKEGDGIKPEYETVTLHDVAKLYAKYEFNFRQVAQRHEPLRRATIDVVIANMGLSEVDRERMYLFCDAVRRI